MGFNELVEGSLVGCAMAVGIGIVGGFAGCNAVWLFVHGRWNLRLQQYHQFWGASFSFFKGGGV
jgi:hypothetical protein